MSKIRWSPKSAPFQTAEELARSFSHIPKRDLARLLRTRAALAEVDLQIAASMEALKPLAKRRTLLVKRLTAQLTHAASRANLKPARRSS